MWPVVWSSSCVLLLVAMVGTLEPWATIKIFLPEVALARAFYHISRKWNQDGEHCDHFLDEEAESRLATTEGAASLVHSFAKQAVSYTKLASVLLLPNPTAHFHTAYTFFSLNHCQIHRTAYFVVLHKGWVYWVTRMWLLLKLTARRLNEPRGTVEMLYPVNITWPCFKW